MGSSYDSGAVEKSNFQRFHWLFFGNFRDDASVIMLLYSDTHFVVSFSVILKCMTLNDLDRLFRVKFCFHAGLAGSDRVTFEK